GRRSRSARVPWGLPEGGRSSTTALFLEHGYAATSMREVARRADVGERTLYDAFPTKAALFLHVVDVGTVGDEGEAPVADRPAFHHVVEADDPRVVIERFAGHAADLLERAGPLIMVAVESAGADDAMRGFAEAGAAATAANVATVVQRLAELDRSIDVATA